MLDLGHFKLHDLYGVNLDSERSNISRDPITLSETTKLLERRALKAKLNFLACFIFVDAMNITLHP